MIGVFPEVVVFLALLFACNNATTTTAPPPQDEAAGSVASALMELQSGQTPDPTPKDREPPAVPEEVTERAPEEPDEGSSGGRKDSPECKAARQKREDQQAKIDRYRDNDVVAAETRFVNAEKAFAWCLGDIGGCASEGEKVQDYQVAVGLAEKGLNDAQFHLGELEAGFYSIDQEIQVACGTSRY